MSSWSGCQDCCNFVDDDVLQLNKKLIVRRSRSTEFEVPQALRQHFLDCGHLFLVSACADSVLNFGRHISRRIVEIAARLYKLKKQMNYSKKLRGMWYVVCPVLCGVRRVWHTDKEGSRRGFRSGGSFVCVLVCLFNLFFGCVRMFLIECVTTNKNFWTVFFQLASCFRVFLKYSVAFWMTWNEIKLNTIKFDYHINLKLSSVRFTEVWFIAVEGVVPPPPFRVGLFGLLLYFWSCYLPPPPPCGWCWQQSIQEWEEGMQHHP